MILYKKYFKKFCTEVLTNIKKCDIILPIKAMTKTDEFNLLTESRGWCDPGSKQTHKSNPFRAEGPKAYASRHLPKMLRKCKALKKRWRFFRRNLSGTAGNVCIFARLKEFYFGTSFFIPYVYRK